MEKIAEKENKNASKKPGTPEAVGTEVTFFDEKLGVTFTLDNSIKKYANDPAILKKTEEVNKRFAKK